MGTATMRSAAAERALDRCRVGDIAAVARVDVEASDASLLRAMGLRAGAIVRVCRVGEPCVIEVISGHQCKCHCRCRIGLARHLASSVWVKEPGAETRATLGAGAVS